MLEDGRRPGGIPKGAAYESRRPSSDGAMLDDGRRLEENPEGAAFECRRSGRWKAGAAVGDCGRAGIEGRRDECVDLCDELISDGATDARRVV